MAGYGINTLWRELDFPIFTATLTRGDRDKRDCGRMVDRGGIRDAGLKNVYVGLS